MSTKPVALFGIGCTSTGQFAEQYRTWFKRRNSRRKHEVEPAKIAYVPTIKSTMRTADFYLIETVGVFIAMRHLLAPTGAAVISDSPLLLSELPHLQPLDWLREAWTFRMQPVDFATFETRRAAAARVTDDHIWQDSTPVSLDRLGLVIEETATGGLLDPVNELTLQLNFVDRQHFRQALARHLSGSLDLGGFEGIARSLIAQGQQETQISAKALTKVLGMLKTRGAIYREAISALLEKKSPARLLKTNNITAFEARYLTRLVATNTSPKPKPQVAAA